jgi:hypothetical protein
MFKDYFYHERIRQTVAIFGSLFTRIHVVRTDSNGKILSTVRVPLAYAPRSKFLARLQQVQDLENDTSIAMKLPRMSFEMVSLAYDSTRQLGKTNSQLVTAKVPAGTKRTKVGQATPYNVVFSLNLIANNQDDALQMVEQILPYFAPQYTVTATPYKDHPSIKEDIPITLQSVSFVNDFDGPQESRQTVQYTLDFEVKINFTGPIDGSASIITKAITDLEFTQGTKYLTITTEADETIMFDSDYGFTTSYDYGEITSDDR